MNEQTNITAEFDELQAFLDELAGKQKVISEATGALRSRLKIILDETGYHKGAFGMMRTIDAMSDTARADFLRTFEPLFACMMDGKWRGRMSDLFGDKEPPAGDGK
jgi:hypothetical protein